MRHQRSHGPLCPAGALVQRVLAAIFVALCARVGLVFLALIAFRAIGAWRAHDAAPPFPRGIRVARAPHRGRWPQGGEASDDVR